MSITPAGSLTSMAAAIGTAASALVISPSAAIWNAGSWVVLRPIKDTFVCMIGLPVADVRTESARLEWALAMRSLKERLTGEGGGGASFRFVTWPVRGAMPGSTTPVMTPVRIVVAC